MALVKFSALISEMRNKLNGSVFSKNRAGNYLRNKITPVNPQTPAQMDVRAQFGNNSQTWRLLTQAQRDSWNAAAPLNPYTNIFGDVKYLSGFGFQMQVNQNLRLAGAPTLLEAPTPRGIPAFSVSNLEAAAGAGTVTFDSSLGTLPANTSLMVYATGNIPAGREYVKNQFRFLGTAAVAAGAVDISAAWADKFGVLIEGQKIFVKARLINTDTGEVTVPYSVDTIVIA